MPLSPTEHKMLWFQIYYDDPRVVQWIQVNKVPQGWRDESAMYAYENMPGAKDWPID